MGCGATKPAQVRPAPASPHMSFNDGALPGAGARSQSFASSPVGSGRGPTFPGSPSGAWAASTDRAASSTRSITSSSSLAGGGGAGGGAGVHFAPAPTDSSGPPFSPSAMLRRRSSGALSSSSAAAGATGLRSISSDELTGREKGSSSVLDREASRKLERGDSDSISHQLSRRPSLSLSRRNSTALIVRTILLLLLPPIFKCPIASRGCYLTRPPAPPFLSLLSAQVPGGPVLVRKNSAVDPPSFISEQRRVTPPR